MPILGVNAVALTWRCAIKAMFFALRYKARLGLFEGLTALAKTSRNLIL
jgi:hypothetical protein